MANKITEATKSFFGLSQEGPFLQRSDFEALANVAEPANADLEAAMKNIEFKRIAATTLNIMSEVLTIALINVVASGNSEIQSTFAWPIFGLLSASTLAKSSITNWQYRLNDIAIQRVFTYLQTIDGLQNSEKKHLLSQWQSEINSMSRAELQFGNLPGNKLFWLTSKLINIAYLFPELTPVIIGQWFLSIIQISGNTRAFKHLQSQFQSVVQENSTAMKLHTKNTKAEKVKEKIAMIKVTLLTTIINTITRSASLPFIWALANGSNLPALIATSLPSLNTLSSEVSETLGSAIGAHIQFTAAAIGRERLEHILEQIQKTQVMIQNHNDRKKHRERLESEPSIKKTFKKKNIVVPKGSTALLFSEVRIPRPKDDVTLIEDLTGYILLDTGKVTVITGGSGKGKSLLAETILQNYLNASGRTGIMYPNGKITDFRDETTNQREFGLYINEDDMPGDIYWADLAFPYNLQIALLATANFDIDDSSIAEFLRMSWGDKIKNANKSKVLTQVFNLIQSHLSNMLHETGLFTDTTKTMKYYLSQEIGHYSDGEKQRLFLSSVYLIPSLPLVIIDEPFRALDSTETSQGYQSSKQAMAKFLLRLENRGTDVIIITHENDTSIKKLLGDDIGCQISLDNGQLTAKSGYEHMVQLTSTPIELEKNQSVEDKKEIIISIDTKIVADIKETLSRLDDQVIDGRSSYAKTFNRIDPLNNKVKKEIKTIIRLFEKIASTLEPNQKFNHDIFSVNEWELVGEAIYFYLDNLDNNERELKIVTNVFETIFYALDSSSLGVAINPVYNGETLKEFLYDFIQLTVTVNNEEFDIAYQQKVNQRSKEITAETRETKETKKTVEIKIPVYSVSEQDIDFLRTYLDDTKNITAVKNAIDLLNKNDDSKPEDILEAQAILDNFFDQFKKLKEFIIKKAETHNVEIGLDTITINDWKEIDDLLTGYFNYLQQNDFLEYEVKRRRYHQTLELFETIFHAIEEEANNIQVDWLVNEYSLKLVVYGLLMIIVNDDLTKYRPEPILVDKIDKRHQQLVAKDKQTKQRIQEEELKDLSD